MTTADTTAMRRARYGASFSAPSVDQEFLELRRATSTAIAKRENLFGRVEGAWATYDGHSVTSESIDFAPRGATVPIPSGSVVLVHDAHRGWTRCLFPQSGQLRGPLVYAVATPSANEVEAVALAPTDEVRQSGERSLTLLFSILPTYVVFVALWKVMPADLGTAWKLLIAAPFGMLLSGFALAFVPMIRRRAERRVLHRLQGSPNTQPARQVELSEDARRLCTDTSLIRAPKAVMEPPKPDREISTALGRVTRSASKPVPSADGGGSLQRGIIKHSVSVIEDISKRAQKGGHLQVNPALKAALVDVISRAETEMQRLEVDGRAKEQDALMQEIRLLRGQMDAYLGRSTAEVAAGY